MKESKIIVENRTGAGNPGFGITTLGFSPTRVTVGFGARGGVRYFLIGA
jgi:hypothetical protein